jgi:23S rRNA pseudouridine1911/1915/1917 synthase
MAEVYARHRCTAAAAGGELYAVVAEAIPGLGRRRARQAIIAGRVTVDGVAVQTPREPVPRAGAVIVCDLSQGLGGRRPAGSAGLGAAVLHRDDDVLVMDKAAGVLSAPDPSAPGEDLPSRLRAAARREHSDLSWLGLVHRLDREASGCLVFARNPAARALLQAQFNRHGAERIYRCLVAGAPHRDTDRLQGRIGRADDGRRSMVGDDRPGKSTDTRFRVLGRFAGATELEVHLGTGRTHQIRVQLAAIGCPILGDRLYGGRGRRGAPSGIHAERLILHAERVAFDHPTTGRRLTVAAPLPRDYRRCLTALRHAAGGDRHAVG